MKYITKTVWLDASETGKKDGSEFAGKEVLRGKELQIWNNEGKCTTIEVNASLGALEMTMGNLEFTAEKAIIQGLPPTPELTEVTCGFLKSCLFALGPYTPHRGFPTLAAEKIEIGKNTIETPFDEPKIYELREHVTLDCEALSTKIGSSDGVVLWLRSGWISTENRKVTAVGKISVFGLVLTEEPPFIVAQNVQIGIINIGNGVEYTSLTGWQEK